MVSTGADLHEGSHQQHGLRVGLPCGGKWRKLFSWGASVAVHGKSPPKELKGRFWRCIINLCIINLCISAKHDAKGWRVVLVFEFYNEAGHNDSSWYSSSLSIQKYVLIV